MGSPKVDQRREAGQRTRTRLMDAALDLLADRGEDAVTLRALTDAAGANVAAVSYHFGSLKTLCEASVAYALERYLDEQEEAGGPLRPQSPLHDAAAGVAPAMIGGPSDRGPGSGLIRGLAPAT